MRLRSLNLAVLLLATSFPICEAFAMPPDASAIMGQARTQAAAEHKNILLVFSASWCGPCHQFEAFLTDKKISPILDRTFVIARLDVGESPTDTRHADTPGAVKYEASLTGENPGFPYIAMLDPTGAPIIDSLRPDKNSKSNVGYPALKVEIEWFMQMLHKAAPSLTPDETHTIQAWLQAHGE